MGTTIPLPGSRFDMRISLGNLIQIGILLGIGLIGWGTINARQESYEHALAQQSDQIDKLTNSLEKSAEIEARTAGDLDQMERRLNRVENELDSRK